MEKENKIVFLDILLIRYKNLINTNVYRKKANSDLLEIFFSKQLEIGNT